MTNEEIFAKAISLSGSAREAFLDGVYHNCPQDRTQMEKMLAAHEDGDSLLASHEPAATADISELPMFDRGVMIGFSQTYFHAENRFWRYFSDSSYWFYLAHLPIQFQILLWIGGEPWNWTLKFLVYVVGTTAVLLPSYHFLVRPTWIGWLLNGRMVPICSKSVPREIIPDLSPANSEAA